MPAATVHFNFLEPVSGLRNRNQLKAFLVSVFKKEQTPLSSLEYIFCSDSYLLQVNRDFLQHDYYTDIITFNLADKKQPVSGEIYISVDRVRDNALAFEQTFQRELHRVIFHGALHLCGYKDKSAKEIKLMRAREDYYLNLYFERLP